MEKLKKLLITLTLLITSTLFVNNVSAETVNYSHLNTFTENVGSENKIISSVEGNATVKNEALYLDGSTYIKYNLNSSLATKLVFDFDFYKNDNSSYPRMLILGGIEREIEVKGSSNSMYINGEISAGWLQNKWNNMRIVYENGTITYFVNDVQIKQESYSDTLTYIQFGKGSSSSNMFNGYIDNFTIYMDSEEITDNMIILNDAWFKGILKYDTTNKAVYVRNNDESEYTLLFNYTKEYFIIQYVFGGLTFVESDISPIYFSSDTSCSYNGEGYTCYSDSTGNIGRDDFMHSYRYNLSNKNTNGELPFGAVSFGTDTILKSNTNIYSLDDNSLLFEKNVADTTTPTISITKESETSVTILEKEYITDVTLKIDFGTIDNEKYLYMYKYGIDSEWTTVTLTENTYITKTYSENNDLYVQILNKEDYSVVTSSSFTVSSINYDFTPYITIDEITSDSCILEEYIICQSLQINSHIADFKKYSFVIIDHTQNTTEKYTKEMTVYKTYYTNSTIEVRIIENETNNIFQTVSFTINTIDEETDNLGQYIKQECSFASIGNNYLCNYYFYNYNPDVYQYYYGTSTSEFEELKLETGTESVFDKTIYKLKNGLGILKEVSYSENTTVYFRVTNKETGELIHTQTFVVSYDEKLEESGKKDIFDIFKNFNNDNSTIKELIDNIWTSIKTSSIYDYIIILIVGALIIVVIKAANR